MTELTTPEDRAIVERNSRAMATLLEDFITALGAYQTMLRDGDFARAWEWLERLALCWRATEEFGFDRQAAEVLTQEGGDLLAALESSLVLAPAADERVRALVLDDAAIRERTLIAGSHGVWKGFDAALDAVYQELERERGARDERKPLTRPRTRTLRPIKRARRAQELVSTYEASTVEGALLYRDLAPDGRELSGADRTRVVAQISVWAACSLALDREHDKISEARHLRMAPYHAAVRSMQRNLVLAVSHDPLKRARAMAFGEVHARIWLAEQLARGVSPEEAVEKAQAAERAGTPPE